MRRQVSGNNQKSIIGFHIKSCVSFGPVLVYAYRTKISFCEGFEAKVQNETKKHSYYFVKVGWKRWVNNSIHRTTTLFWMASFSQQPADRRSRTNTSQHFTSLSAVWPASDSETFHRTPTMKKYFLFASCWLAVSVCLRKKPVVRERIFFYFLAECQKLKQQTFYYNAYSALPYKTLIRKTTFSELVLIAWAASWIF